MFRPGSGNGSLLESDSLKKFSDYKVSRNGKEQLIDVELWRTASAYGPMHVGLWTADFVAKWNDLGSQKTLVDLEEYSALPLRVP